MSRTEARGLHGLGICLPAGRRTNPNPGSDSPSPQEPLCGPSRGFSGLRKGGEGYPFPIPPPMAPWRRSPVRADPGPRHTQATKLQPPLFPAVTTGNQK